MPPRPRAPSPVAPEASKAPAAPVVGDAFVPADPLHAPRAGQAPQAAEATRMPPAIESCEVCRLGRAARPGPCPYRNQTRAAGEALFTQGERATSVLFVRAGTVLLTAAGAAGEETLCALRGPGSLLGLEALHELPLPSSAWALSPVSVCSLPADAFRAWVGRREDPIGAVLDLALDEVIRRQHERIALSGRAPVRLARFLLARHQADPDAAHAVQHQMLARMLGMRPETLSRAAARLRSLGALGAGLQVVDVEALRRYVGEAESAEE